MRIKTLEEWRHERSELLERVYGVIAGLSQSLRVYDCADLNVPRLARMFVVVTEAIEGIGYTIGAYRKRGAGRAGGCATPRRDCGPPKKR